MGTLVMVLVVTSLVIGLPSAGRLVALRVLDTVRHRREVRAENLARSIRSLELELGIIPLSPLGAQYYGYRPTSTTARRTSTTARRNEIYNEDLGRGLDC